jgi:hypothetical protein
MSQFVGQNVDGTYGNFDWSKVKFDLSGAMSLFKISEQDLKELKNSQKQKIVLTKPFAEYKIGDVLEVKTFPNTQQSEPPKFLVIDEKLGSPKYGFGGRGSEPFFKEIKDDVQTINTIAVKQISDSKIGNKTLNIEEKFYESLGIKTEGGYDWTVKAKGRLLVAVTLVAGYFAYKKFKN